MGVETVLFEALTDAQVVQLPPGTASSGKDFEDLMMKQLHTTLAQQAGLYVYPPRYTLSQATYSGVAHQFDIVIRENQLAALECKFRRTIGIDHLFGFVGKLVDYRQPPRGIFVTTAENASDDCFCYAIAHRISMVCRFLPPVEYMLNRVKTDTELARRLWSLQMRLQQENVPRRVLVQWRNEYGRFIAEGYRA